MSVILPCLRLTALPEDIVLFHKAEKYFWHLVAEAKDAAKHTTVLRASSYLFYFTEQKVVARMTL